MKKIFLIILLITGFLLNALSQENNQKHRLEQLHQLFKTYTEEEVIRNAFFRIETADQSILIDTVVGKFADGEEVTLNTPYYTASIGKTFTATAITLLVDQGKLAFEDRVADHLGKVVTGLSVIDGVDYSKELTIHHLLSHTSGMADYFEDTPISGVNMMQKLITEPDHFWKPMELIDFTRQHFKARFQPGLGYHYSDTEYVLLGLIIEKVTKIPLHQFFEKYIINPLSMELTSMNLWSEPVKRPDFPLAEIYAGPIEISRYQSLSADWAGGAIRSSGRDLNDFIKAIFQGNLISESSLQKMQQWVPESKGTYYGYGLRKWVLNELNPSWPALTLIGHSGSTGAYMYFCPELDIYLSGTFNNTDYMQQHIMFLAEILIGISTNSK
ncbi:serine hydrolase domain-containing protein [Roseivirga misakiensis]|uniref:Beta-lactamase-related domain-containing protein n=1 Tax=Roseivirga misakiensis TaxID=1563681 RepID=A0A1E5SYB9_9BACT|nr:serine hydrolase domain-containing protein [Roseivirga misakiensis]OEK04037.1 hypothetical protein BFP71_11105 [Roseivirga misakiensis]